MFFRRKKKEQAPSRIELRRHYRRAPAKKHALGVKLLPGASTALAGSADADSAGGRGEAPGGVPVAGELLDLSAGGAGVFFPAARDPELEVGDSVNLSFTSLVHGGEIRAAARVATSVEEEEPRRGRRYGFEFTDCEALFAQLDAYYFNFFNRRRAMRVRPALDKKLPAEISYHDETFGDQSVPIIFHDISPDGFGAILSADKAPTLDGVTRLEVQLQLPGQEEPMGWKALLIHRSLRGRSLVVGAVFLMDESEAVGPERQALADYCARREAEIALWDSQSASA